MSAFNYQTEYCEAFCDVDWERYNSTEFENIKTKIAFALFGSPQDTELELEDASQILAGYSKKQIQMVTPLYDKIINYKKYSLDGNTIFMTIIFTCCVPLDKTAQLLVHSLIETDKLVVKPVFKIRKCVRDTNSDKSCCIYMDDEGRVYKGWNQYLTENLLPKGVMIVPKNGKYAWSSCENDERIVLLEAHKSPACSIIARTKKVLNVSSTVAGVGATAVIGTALFTPVAIPILTGATVVGLGAGIYSATTSFFSLKDRSKHQQNIGLKDPESRNCWINIAATSFGVTAGIASKYIAKGVSNGVVISQAVRGVYNTSLVGSAVTGFAGISSGLHTMIVKYNEDKKKPSTLELAQFSSSVFFFTHSMVNFKMANTIIEETQISTIDAQRDMLMSNSHRKIFDKMSGETRRRHGNIESANTEIIRSINYIENKDSFFASALRMNTELNENQIRISFNEDGSAALNTDHTINPELHTSLSTAERNLEYSSIDPCRLSTSNYPARLRTPQNTLTIDTFQIIETIPSVIKLFNMGESFINSWNCVNGMTVNRIIFDSTNYLQDLFPDFLLFPVESKRFIMDSICSIVDKLISNLSPHHREIYLHYIAVLPNRPEELAFQFISEKLKEFSETLAISILDYLKLYFIDKYHEISLNAFVKCWLESEVPYINSPICCNICKGVKYSD